jgi:hypothetical protein
MASTHRLRVVGRDEKTQEPTAVNSEVALAYDGLGNLIQMDRTVGVITYRRTFTWVGDNLTAISAWVKL